MENSVKPGWTTSEFWLHILANAPVVLALIPGFAIPAGVVVLITAVSHVAAAFYGSSRADLKGKALDIAAGALEAAAAKAASK